MVSKDGTRSAEDHPADSLTYSSSGSVGATEASPTSWQGTPRLDSVADTPQLASERASAQFLSESKQLDFEQSDIKEEYSGDKQLRRSRATQ
jgi:hypothetical protein